MHSELVVAALLLSVSAVAAPVEIQVFFFSSRRRHTRYIGDWSSDVCSSDLRLAGAQTGTGKTAAFTLPMLHKLSTGQGKTNKFGKDGIAALVLTPTRELAAQVEESIRTYGKYLPLDSTVIFGGVGMNPQIDKIRRGVDILVATPGRLLDLQQQGNLDLSTVEILVLDEADRMLDMGFLPDVKKILALLPKEKQSLLFSASFSDEIRDLANG